MADPRLQSTPDRPPCTSVWTRLLNILASPSEVVDEVAISPPKHANWLLPTLLVCATGLILLCATGDKNSAVTAVAKLSLASQLSGAQADWLSRHWRLISSSSVCLGAFVGLFWSAFVIWFIGRVPFKSHFPFVKALEAVGLTSSILVLGTIVTALLTLATGDALARPALSLLVLKIDPGSEDRLALETLNLFHWWTVAILALSLSRLSAVSFKEAAFWVFGYWVVARLAIILLA
jgi:hypothetical protein